MQNQTLIKLTILLFQLIFQGFDIIFKILTAFRLIFKFIIKLGDFILEIIDLFLLVFDLLFKL